jgi:hypothetical protein
MSDREILNVKRISSINVGKGNIVIANIETTSSKTPTLRLLKVLIVKY